jgi:xanthine/uracil permease
MEKYIKILPYFLAACFIGITASLLFGTTNEKITRIRLVREMFGALWISAICYFLLKQFLSWNDELVYGLCSLVAFLNSKIINFVGKDLFESVTKGLLEKIKTLFNNSNN